jgi:hypothetical protein
MGYIGASLKSCLTSALLIRLPNGVGDWLDHSNCLLYGSTWPLFVYFVNNAFVSVRTAFKN